MGHPGLTKKAMLISTWGRILKPEVIIFEVEPGKSAVRSTRIDSIYHGNRSRMAAGRTKH